MFLLNLRRAISGLVFYVCRLLVLLVLLVIILGLNRGRLQGAAAATVLLGRVNRHQACAGAFSGRRARPAAVTAPVLAC